MDIARSDIVVSTAGRDRGMVFVVLDVDGDYLLLADGRLRRVEKPKRKKLKHVRYQAPCGDFGAEKLKNGGRVTNSEIRRMLSEYAAQAGGF